MKAKLALLALISFVLAGPLAGSEAIWEIIVPTDLEPASSGVPGPLTEPALTPAEALTIEAGSAARAAVMPVVPSFRPIVRPGKALFDANLILMVGLNVADYVSTRQALKYPGLSETNPLMKPFVKSPAVFAAVKFGTTALSYLSMKAIFKKNRTVAWIMTTASNVLLSCVVANNYRLIQGARAAAR